MDFSLSDRVQELSGRIRAFVDAEVIPLEPQLMREGFGATLPAIEAARVKCKSAGLWAPALSVELGGMGLTLSEFAHISELLGGSPLGHYVFNVQAPDIGNMEILHRFGSEMQKTRWLEPLAAGKTRSCFSMTEPAFAGSNPVQMGTTAVRDGDSYVLNGTKWFTTAADGAAFAVVMAVTDPDAASPYARASQIIVPTDTPGFRIIRNIPIMGEEGEGWMSHAEVAYEDCRVPRENLLGGQGAGFAIAQERLGPGRIHHCMRWIGVCERALDMLCRRAATRELSPGKVLGTKQTIQNWIAESRSEIDAARLMVLHAAWRIDREGAKAARESISTIKFFVAGIMQQVIDRTLQVHGALGMTDDTLISFWYRHERAARIYDGPDEVHKAVVARRILGRYGVKRS